jgi:dihydrofolate reductase
VIISLIGATDELGGIGKNNELPWHLPSDLKRFKLSTMGHHVVMGRRTYEAIGRQLPGRVMIVVTHKNDYFAEGCLVVNSLGAAIDLAEVNFESELFIIGGGEIFKQAIGIADKIYLTTVHTNVGADVFFPKFDPNEWEITSEENIIKIDNEDYESDFKLLIKIH